MRTKLAVLALFFCGAVMSLSAPAHATSPDFERAPTVTKLTNGFTVLVQEDRRFPLASIRLYAGTGSSYEDADTAGISHLLEHMVFKGTQKRPQGGAAAAIESVGGYINAATSFDYTVYIADVPAENWSLGMDVLRDMAIAPALDPQALENEKKVVLAELERGEDTPSSLLFKTMQSMVWKGTTYERPIIGYRDTVEAITSQDLREYIETHYQPQNMLLVVCGAVKQGDVLAEARRLFGSLRNDREMTPPRPVRPAVAEAPSVRVVKGPWNKVYMTAALPAPSYLSERSIPLEVLAHILGGDRSSRFYRKFKYTMGLVDNISISDISVERTGMLYVHAMLKPENLDTFWKELTAELAAVDPSDFTDEEIARAKLNLEDSLFRAKETLSGLASKLGFFQFFLHSPVAEENYLTALRGVDREQLVELARDVLKPERLSAAALVPNDAEKPEDADKDAKSEDAIAASLLQTLETQWPAAVADNAENDPAQARAQAEPIDLGQGRTLVLIPDATLPYTSVDLTFTGGDALLGSVQGPKSQGLAELTARVLTKGAGTRTATDIQDFLADRASSIGAASGRETFTISARFPTRFTADVLSLFDDVLTSATFPPEELKREQDNQIASIRSREDQPLGLAFRNLFPFLFQDSSYSYYHRGTPEGVRGFDVKQAKTFWQAQQKAPWVMAVCGDFDRKAVVDLARALADRSSVDAPAIPAVPRWTREMSKSMVLEDRNQSHLLMIFPAVPQGHEDTPALELLRTVLAGQGGLLFRDMRDEQGLGYTVTALLWQGRAAGLAAFYIGTYPDKEAQALEGFRTAARTLAATALPEEELRRGVNTLRGDYFREHQSLDSRSSEAAGLLSRGFPLDYRRKLVDSVRSITPEQLRRIAKKYLDPDKAHIMRVVPE